MENNTPALQLSNPMLVGVPPEAVRHCTVPIPTTLLAEYISNKKLFYVVNYSNSEVSGAKFLNYLANLVMPCDIDFDFPLPYHEFDSLMEAYFNQKVIAGPASLHILAAIILMAAKGMEYLCIPYEFPVEEAHVYAFIEKHKDLVGRHLHFLDSTQVYALASIKSLNAHYEPKERFENIDDAHYVSPNVAMMYRLPEFTSLYFHIKDKAPPRMSYFVHQFEEAINKTDKLGVYFRGRNNLVCHMFEHLAQGTFRSGDICDGVFKNGVFDSNGEHYEPKAFDYKEPVVEEGQE